jgi:hypothetical protein
MVQENQTYTLIFNDLWDGIYENTDERKDG